MLIKFDPLVIVNKKSISIKQPVKRGNNEKTAVIMKMAESCWKFIDL